MKPTGIPMPVIKRVAKKHGLGVYFDTLGDYIHVPRIPNLSPTAEWLAKLDATVKELSALAGRTLVTGGTPYLTAYTELYRLDFQPTP